MRPSGHFRFFKGKKWFSNHSVIDFDFWFDFFFFLVWWKSNQIIHYDFKKNSNQSKITNFDLIWLIWFPKENRKHCWRESYNFKTPMFIMKVNTCFGGVNFPTWKPSEIGRWVRHRKFTDSDDIYVLRLYKALEGVVGKLESCIAEKFLILG